MKKNEFIMVLCTAVMTVAITSTAMAHHSAAQFDSSPTARKNFTGMVTKFQWQNPHVFIFLDVKQPDGRTINWALEMASPGSLRRSGLDFNSLKAGDAITVAVSPRRDGAPMGALSGGIKFADGRVWEERRGQPAPPAAQ